jgi:hypothetical protein
VNREIEVETSKMPEIATIGNELGLIDRAA